MYLSLEYLSRGQKIEIGGHATWRLTLAIGGVGRLPE